MKSKSALFILFMLALFLVIANAQSNNPTGSSVPSGSIPSFEFRIRSAFSLTPAMVQAIQASSSKQTTHKESQNTAPNPANMPNWDNPILKSVNLASPLGIQIKSEQVVALIMFTPLELAQKNLTMLVQNQIWSKSSGDSIQMNTSFHTIRVPLGILFYYYPLGTDPKQGAPVALELFIEQK